MSRHDFTEADKRLLAERVGYHCSNPACGVSTVGPSTNSEEKEYVGVAAHIYSASIDNGPRANPTMKEKDRKSIANGIHLCNKCSTQIDKNSGRGYPPEILFQWKKNAEFVARKRVYQNQSINLYHPVEFINLEKQYSAALTCSGLGEKNVSSCPSNQQYIDEIATKLTLASKCIIKGDSGCGKSLLTYQVAKVFNDEGRSVYRLNKRILIEGGGIINPSQKSLIIIDDSQTIDITQLENLIEYSNEDCMILLNWNSSTSNSSDFLRSYPCVDIVSSQQVEMLKQYCIDNKKHIATLLMRMGVKISDRYYHETIETRIERASREKTPWLFNYALTEGWRNANNDIKLLKDRERLDLVMITVAAYQYATLDQGVSEDIIVAELRKYCSDIAWLNKVFEVLKGYCTSNDGLIRHKHYQYAKEVLEKFIFNEKPNTPQQEYAIDLFKNILLDGNLEKGHGNILEFILFDYKYCHYIMKKDGFIKKIASDLFSQPLYSFPTKVRKLNSIIRFDNNMISIIDEHINILNDWLANCDRDSAYPLSHLLNTLINAKYKNLIITDAMLESLFDKLLKSNLLDKSRYSSLIIRLGFFFSEKQKDKCKSILEKSGLTVDISNYPIGEEHYRFSELIHNLSYINEEWADKCVHSNIESIAGNLNNDLLKGYESYKELLDEYFGVVHWILDIKIISKIKNSTAKKLAKLIKAEAVLSALKKIDLTKTQQFYTFLIFLKMYNKKLLSKISKKIDYDHLKGIYQNDSKLDHDHQCIIQLLYNINSKPYNDYVDYVISNNEEIVDLLIAINPTKSLEEMKKGKPYKMKATFAREYGIVLNLLNTLDTNGEVNLSLKILKDNIEEIKNGIFTKSTNVDDAKQKHDFFVYIYKKTPGILRNIFSSREDVDKLFVKIKRLLKGKKAEKNMGRLYMFFIKTFTKSHTASITAIETRYPSVRNYII